MIKHLKESNIEKLVSFSEIDKDKGSVKMFEKKGPGQLNKMLSEPNLNYKPFRVYTTT